jgi:hypothetical protein
MTSGVYISKAARRSESTRRRRTPLWCRITIVLGILLMLIAGGTAYAAIVLHGRGVLNAPAMQTSNLQVSDVRLSRPLTPGAAVDLLFSVRNPSAFGVLVDQVTLVGVLRKAAPAGCTSKVAGPVTKKAGYRLPRADQVLVGAGVKKGVVVHAAFTLAATAKAGCGFTAEVDVSATQQTSPANPTAKPTMPSSTSTIIPNHGVPTSQAATTAVITEPPATVTPPPGLPTGADCDTNDPACLIPPGLPS